MSKERPVEEDIKTETNNAPPMTEAEELQARRRAMLPSRAATLDELTRKERETVKLEALRLTMWPAEVVHLAVLALSALDAAADMIRLHREDKGIPAIPRDAYRLVAYVELTTPSMVAAIRDAGKAWAEHA